MVIMPKRNSAPLFPFTTRRRVRRKRGAEMGIIVIIKHLKWVRVCEVEGERGERINGIRGSVRQGEIIRHNARIYRVGIFMNHTIAMCRHIAIHTWGGGG